MAPEVGRKSNANTKGIVVGPVESLGNFAPAVADAGRAMLGFREATFPSLQLLDPEMQGRSTQQRLGAPFNRLHLHLKTPNSGCRKQQDGHLKMLRMTDACTTVHETKHAYPNTSLHSIGIWR